MPHRIVRFVVLAALLVAVIAVSGCATATSIATPTATPIASELQLAPPLTGHNGWVIELAFSRDGKMLASGSDDGSVILWDVRDPTAPTQFSPPLEEYPCCVWSLALSPDARILATTSYTNTRAPIDVIYLWDVSDPSAPVLLHPPLAGGHDTMRSLAFSPDGRILAAGNDDHTVTLWDMADPAAPVMFSSPLQGHQSWMLHVAFRPDGRLLASGDADGDVILWSMGDPKAPARLATISGREDAVSALAFSPDGNTLAAGGEDGVYLWDVSSPEVPAMLEVLPTGVETGVASLDFSPDGGMLASSVGEMAILWDISDRSAPTCLGALLGHKDSVYSVAFSPDRKILATGSGDNTIILWNVSKPNLARLPPVPTPIPAQESTEEATAVVNTTAKELDPSAVATVTAAASIDIPEGKYLFITATETENTCMTNCSCPEPWYTNWSQLSSSEQSEQIGAMIQGGAWGFAHVVVKRNYGSCSCTVDEEWLAPISHQPSTFEALDLLPLQGLDVVLYGVERDGTIVAEVRGVTYSFKPGDTWSRTYRADVTSPPDSEMCQSFTHTESLFFRNDGLVDESLFP